jgi:hypothetical protein
MSSTIFKLGINFFRQFTCPVASQHTTNSAYIVDEVVTVCLELFYDIAPSARVNIYPDVDFLSSPA